MSKDLEVSVLASQGLGRTDCKARKGDLRCTLDAIHREIGFSHLHIEDGTLIWWRAE